MSKYIKEENIKNHKISKNRISENSNNLENAANRSNENNFESGNKKSNNKYKANKSNRNNKDVIIKNVILILLLLMVVLPVLSLLPWAFTQRWPWPEFFPGELSLRGIQSIAQNPQLPKLMLSSTGISLLVALLSVLVAIATARALVIHKIWGREGIYFLALLPFLVPSTVFAMGIQVWFLKTKIGGTVTGVVIAHLIYALPYATVLLMDGTRVFGRKLEEQAQVLGASNWQGFWRVSLPNLAPAILAAMSMSFILSFSQYFLTLLIGGGRVQTFSIVMVPYLQSGDRSIASVYSLIFLGISLLVFALMELLIARWSKNSG